MLTSERRTLACRATLNKHATIWSSDGARLEGRYQLLVAGAARARGGEAFARARPGEDADLAAVLRPRPVRAFFADRALRVLARLDDAGLLERGLRGLRRFGLADDDQVRQGGALIRAELWLRGLGRAGAGSAYESWEDLARRHLALVRASRVPTAGPGAPSRLADPTFVAELEALSGARFRDGSAVTALIDGPASFALRERLIEGARTGIHLVSWAIYDDETGWDTARRLVRRAGEGVRVRVVVDGQIAEQRRFGPPVAFLEERGVEVVRWRDPARPFDGTHRKLLVVDGRDAWHLESDRRPQRDPHPVPQQSRPGLTHRLPRYTAPHGRVEPSKVPT